MSQSPDPRAALATYPLLDALRDRRSRRFAPGMKIEHGPFAYTSAEPPRPLTEDEEAALAFAACGVTGYALADLAYGRGHGGQMLAGLLGRTVGSPDAINCVSLVITNDEATYLLKRPQDFSPAEYPEIVRLARAGELTELYRRSRVKIADQRCAPPVRPVFNFNINNWSMYAKGGSYFLPVNEITLILINCLLEAFDEDMAIYLVDERNDCRPAGLDRFRQSKGGHLNDDLSAGRVGTIQVIEGSLIEAVGVEQGMVLQNIGLAAQALGLGGFTNFARHDYGWFEALGFRMGKMPVSKYLAMSWLRSKALGLIGKDLSWPIPIGLERNGEVLLKPFCPPYYPTMADAVHAVVDYKFATQGVFRGGTHSSAWKDPAGAAPKIPAPSEKAIAATIAYCEYVYDRYGRFPVYSPPFRTMVGYQATHVDVAFYDRFYTPDALSETQRARWR